MRKSVFAVVGALAFIVGPAAFAASYTSTANHNIDVTIPAVAFLRIYNSGTSLSFTPSANDVANGVSLTGTSGQDVLEALVNKGTWSLGVSVSTSGSTTSWASSSSSGLALSQITVTTGTAGTGVPTLLSSFDLGTIATANASLTAADGSGPFNGMALVANGTGSKTDGWQPVGIDAGSYSLQLTGNESPGSYSVVVTYVLTTP